MISEAIVTAGVIGVISREIYLYSRPKLVEYAPGQWAIKYLTQYQSLQNPGHRWIDSQHIRRWCVGSEELVRGIFERITHKEPKPTPVIHWTEPKPYTLRAWQWAKSKLGMPQ